MLSRTRHVSDGVYTWGQVRVDMACSQMPGTGGMRLQYGVNPRVNNALEAEFGVSKKIVQFINRMLHSCVSFVSKMPYAPARFYQDVTVKQAENGTPYTRMHIWLQNGRKQLKFSVRFYVPKGLWPDKGACAKKGYKVYKHDNG